MYLYQPEWANISSGPIIFSHPLAFSVKANEWRERYYWFNLVNHLSRQLLCNCSLLAITWSEQCLLQYASSGKGVGGRSDCIDLLRTTHQCLHGLVVNQLSPTNSFATAHLHSRRLMLGSFVACFRVIVTHAILAGQLFRRLCGRQTMFSCVTILIWLGEPPPWQGPWHHKPEHQNVHSVRAGTSNNFEDTQQTDTTKHVEENKPTNELRKLAFFVIMISVPVQSRFIRKTDGITSHRRSFPSCKWKHWFLQVSYWRENRHSETGNQLHWNFPGPQAWCSWSR